MKQTDEALRRIAKDFTDMKVPFYKSLVLVNAVVTLMAATTKQTFAGANIGSKAHDHNGPAAVASRKKVEAMQSVVAAQEWIQQYSATGQGNGKAALHTQGRALLQQRRAALRELIQIDPSLALTSAISDSQRAAVPQDLRDELETPVSGIGDLSVLIYCPGPDGVTRPMERKVTLNGNKYTAYVYGRRASQTSKFGVPLSGIVIDGFLALDESPIKQVEATSAHGNASFAKGANKFTAQEELTGEVGGQQYKFNSRAHFNSIKAELESAEAALGPNPAKSAAAILAGDSVNAASGGTGGTGSNAPTAWTVGLKKVLIIRVDFSDHPGDPTFPGIVDTEPYVRGVADNQVSPFYSTSSYHQTSLSNVVTTQLYRLPKASDQYYPTFDVDGLHADARTLAAADYNLGDYDRICVVFTFIPQFGFGGLAQLGAPNLWVNGEFDFRVYSHELGHTYGLLHAGSLTVTDGNPISPSGTIVEYGDDYDTMGANFANDLRTDFNPYYKNMLGWLRDDQVASVGPAPATYRIYTFDGVNNLEATNAPLLAVRILKDGNKSYWIGLRDNFTDNVAMDNGAYVIWGYNQAGAGGGGGFQSALLDMTTPGNTIADAALLNGATFNDAGLGISFQPSNPGGNAPNSFVDININGGGPSGGGGPGLLLTTNYLSGGNGNGVIDVNECNTLDLVLTNAGSVGATTVTVIASTTTPGVTIGTRSATFPDLPVASGATNTTPLTISTAPFFICGTPITLDVQIKSDQGTTASRIILATGQPGSPTRFDNTTPAFIRDADLVGTNSLITVSNITSAINKITVSMFMTHTFVSDLTFELISPDGQTNLLFDHTGAGGDNFGASCAPENFRTTFDDSASGSISAGAAPYVGSFQPLQPLSVFVGKYGTNVNGVWKLHVVDSVGLDVGFIQCWSLNITAASCVDGGGTCPGAELALGMTDAPDPTYIGSNLVYSITVTNNGPSEAKNVVVNQTLPSSVVFYSGISSVGNVTHAGNAVIANLGILPINGIATVTVTVIPTLTGTISSTASVSANDVDVDLSNNSRTVTTSVNQPASDIAVGITDLPDPALVGGTLTYTVNVTNNGPSTASGVFVTNTLPLTVGIQSATATQGSMTIIGNKVIHNVGVLNVNSRATATIAVTPLVTGTIVATSVGKANQADPFPANNTATATTTIGPSSDLALTMTDSPDPAVVNSNWVYTITVTNNGPSAASGVVVNQTVPANVTIVSAASTSGTVATGAGSVTATVGSLANGAGAVITVTAKSAIVGTYASSATVTASQTDATPGNNSASVTTSVSQPFVSIVAAGATLTAESVSPADGGLSVGETVSVSMRLRNAGNIASGTVTATLLATNGVTAPVGTALSYGALTASGSAGSQTFSFTASGTNGGTVLATLQVFTNGVFHGNATFTFTLPTVRAFANTNSITINDASIATPYASTIAVTGVTGLVGKVTVTISNLSHTYPDDIDMLLVSPSGQKVLLMSDAGGQPGNSAGVNAINVTFDDAAALIANEGPMVSGSYHPSDYEPGDVFPATAPAGPYGTNLSAFIGGNPNGSWSLYIVDDTSGDSGLISKGWSISFTTLTPINQVADLGLTVASAPNPVLVGGNLTNTFTIANAGPNAAANITFTNTVPGTATIVSATTSQGSVTINGNVVTANIASLNASASATVTVVAAPGINAIPSLTSTANVATTDTDLNPANNSVSAVSTVSLPSANIGITQSMVTNVLSLAGPVNFNITINVTNAGPDTALNVLLTDVLPSGIGYVSSSLGSATNLAGTVTIGLGNLAAGSLTSFTITESVLTTGAKTNTATISTASSDSVSANNSAALTFNVIAPSPSIVAAGALITSENVKTNGAVDLNETVTVSLTLQNIGDAATTGLRATLQSTGASQSYGVLAQAGGSQTRSFTFTAPAVNNGPVIATLALQDEGVSVTNNLGTVSFVFNLPSSASFTNSTAIVIPDSGAAAPYPSSITVSGLTGVVSSASVRLSGLTHGFPDDLDILLVSPSGKKMVLMSDAGGGHGVSGVTLNFADANSASLPDSLPITSGDFKPSNYEGNSDSFSAPAPSGTPGSDFTVFNGSNPNGEWALYVMDDSTGDLGNIAGGWSLTLNTISVINPLADISVTISAAPDFGAPNPPFVGSAVTYSIGVTNNGPDTATAVTVSDSLPVGLAFISAAQSQGSSLNNAGLVTFNVGSLASGAGAGLSIRVAASAGGAFGNTVSATAAETDLTTANNSALANITVRVPVVPVLSAVTMTNAQTQFTLTGDAGMSYQILGSTNLTTWTVLGTSTAAANGTIKFTDTSATNYSSRYYRAQRVIP